MSHLLRSHAPISDLGWQLLDEEARQRLAPALGGRRLVDFSGPLGWQHAATNLGRTSPLASAPRKGVSGLQRVVLPLVELRADFELSRSELFGADRGAGDVDLGPLDEAALRIAETENAAVFGGWKGAMTGIAEAAPYPRASLGKAESYPTRIATAVERLLGSGIAGPYGLALGADQYRVVLESADRGGYPLIEHLGRILEGPIVWTPGVKGAVVVSLRGGDFVLECGQDIAIGYASHDDEVVRLYLEESFSFRVATPEAAVALAP
jgi:uncharacterized linocin/CFP29 family protein